VQYPQAQVLELGDIGKEDFLAAATKLHAES
jgi:hypothetical protein